MTLNRKDRAMLRLLQLGLILMCVKNALSNTGISEISEYKNILDSILQVLSVGFMIISAIKSSMTVRQGMLCAASEAVCAYVYMRTGIALLAITMLTCFIIANRNFDSVVRLLYRTALVLFLCNAVFFCIQFVEGKDSIYVLSELGKRYKISFSHPNFASIYYFNIVLMWMWLHYGKVKWHHVLGIVLLTLGVYSLTKTRTMLAEIGITLLLYGLSQIRRGSIENLMTWAARIVIPLLFVLIYICVIKYRSGNAVIEFLDTMLSGRIKLGAYAYSRWGASWLGQSIDLTDVQWDSTWKLNTATFDCIYSYFLVNLGMIWGICIYILLFKLSEIRDTKINMFIILWALYGIAEVHGLNGFMCFPILLISQLFKNEHDKAGKHLRAVL